MQAAHLTILGIVALAFVGTSATDLAPAPMVSSPESQVPAKRLAARPRPAPVADHDLPMSNVDLRNAEFDRLRDKGFSGGKLTDKEKRTFTDEVIRRLQTGGPQH